MAPTITSVAATWARSCATPLPLAAEEVVGGGEARERRALDLGRPEGVPGEDEGRLVAGHEAGLRVRLGYPAVAPAGEGGLEDPGREVGAELPSGEREERGRDLSLVGVEVRAAPLGSGVDRDGGRARDTLASVVPDPVERLALDLDAAGLGHTGRPVEQRHEREAGGVGDLLEPPPRLFG